MEQQLKAEIQIMRKERIERLRLKLINGETLIEEPTHLYDNSFLDDLMSASEHLLCNIDPITDQIAILINRYFWRKLDIEEKRVAIEKIFTLRHKIHTLKSYLKECL